MRDKSRDDEDEKVTLAKYCSTKTGLAWQDYVARITSENFKGDEICLIALANVFDVRIYLWKTEGDYRVPLHFFPSGKKSRDHFLKILNIYSIGNSFYSLLKLDESKPAASETRHHHHLLHQPAVGSSEPQPLEIQSRDTFPQFENNQTQLEEFAEIKNTKDSRFKYFVRKDKVQISFFENFLVVGTQKKFVVIPWQLLWVQDTNSQLEVNLKTPFSTFNLRSYKETKNWAGTILKLKAETSTLTRYLWFRYPDNGDIYEGSVQDGKRQGNGSQRSQANEYTYSGDWNNDKFHGYAVVKYGNELRYEGTWENGFPVGKGTMTFPTGETYRGDIAGLVSKDGVMATPIRNGIGLYTFDNGRSHYFGHWKVDQRDGRGRQVMSNGDLYLGNWREEKLEGVAVAVFNSKIAYSGIWSQGKQKQGYMAYENGDVYLGKWDYSSRDTVKDYFNGARYQISMILEDVSHPFGAKIRDEIAHFVNSPMMEATLVDETKILLERISAEISLYLKLEISELIELVPIQRLCHLMIFPKIYRYVIRWYKLKYDRQDYMYFRYTDTKDDVNKQKHAHHYPREAVRILKSLPDLQSPLEKYNVMMQVMQLMRPYLQIQRNSKLKDSLSGKVVLLPKTPSSLIYLLKKANLKRIFSELKFLMDFRGFLPTFNEFNLSLLSETDIDFPIPNLKSFEETIQLVNVIIAMEEQLPEIEDEAEVAGYRDPHLEGWNPRENSLESEYCIPQYCHSLVRLPSVSSVFYDFLWQKCSRELHFALNMHWQLSTMRERYSKNPKGLQPSTMSLNFLENLGNFWKTQGISFENQLNFVKKLENLTQITLKGILEELNSQLPAAKLYLPIFRSMSPYHIILRIPPSEAKIFNSKTAPVLLFMEILVSQTKKLGSDNLEEEAQILLNDFDQKKNSLPAPQVVPKSTNEKNWPFGEYYHEKRERIRRESPYGSLPNWDLVAVIMKRDNCVNEATAMQFIENFHQIFIKEHLDIFVRPYRIVLTTMDTALIEVLKDVISFSSLRKYLGLSDLTGYFIQRYGAVGTVGFNKAQMNFVQSLAGYSLVSYFLQVKDRHNENLMIDTEGHLVHIDFAFSIGSYPGEKGIISLVGPLEPEFKMTTEYVKFMGEKFSEFVHLMKKGFLAIRKYHHELWWLVHNLDIGEQDFYHRFKLNLTDEECDAFVESLIQHSLNHIGTIGTDIVNYYWKGIQY
eukprot:TRINITY_DN4054_c0_g1_i5.p1 TRINITY_DN4054_c0_g1~~TRINITY_DN4054_c0_g1_i5.p1  ORF type:complete len:1203 (+),score=435.14 TRINITY_DN4054_c0_g1_i5:693-4301(+)